MAARASLFLASALSLGAMSSSKDGIPALARCAAMREPIVPAPSTAARRTRRGCVEVSGDETETAAAMLMRESLSAALTPRQNTRSVPRIRNGAKRGQGTGTQGTREHRNDHFCQMIAPERI